MPWKNPSDYYKELTAIEDKQQYENKLTLSNGVLLSDPYGIKNGWKHDIHDSKLLPPVLYPDIYHYLINTPSVFTKEGLKAYKSLEAYEYFSCGHVL